MPFLPRFKLEKVQRDLYRYDSSRSQLLEYISPRKVVTSQEATKNTRVNEVEHAANGGVQEFSTFAISKLCQNHQTPIS